jgi:integrase
MPIVNLTDARLRGLKPSDGELIDQRTGLIARADRSGKVAFSFRYRAQGKRRRLILGGFPDGLSLADARIEVNRVREAVRKGTDPVTDRRASRAAPAAMTFRELADLFIERYARRSTSSWRATQRHLRVDVCPHWGERPAASIVRRDAAALLFALAECAPIGANKVKAILSKLFNWSVDAGLLETSPMYGVRAPTRKGRGRTRALSDPEIAVLWHALDRSDVRPGTRAALRIVLLTAARPGEAAGMVDDELHHLGDAGAAFWQIPAHRAKSRRPLVLPLVGLAREVILTELAGPRASDFVFAGRFARGMGRNAMSQALSRVLDDLGEEGASLKRDKPRPHDLRRSAISGMARIGIARDDRMAVAGHSYGDAHAIYDRHDRLIEKRTALMRWDAHIRRIVADQPADGTEIVTLRSAVL